MTVLAVIPARGGSKGVPRKNLRTVGGVSLVCRAVACARESGVVDRVLVSSDDPAIRDHALACGAEAPFLRPAGLAGDRTPGIDAVLHAVRAFEEHDGARVDLVVLLEPPHPFRRPGTVARAVERYRRGGVGSVIGVFPLRRKPSNIFEKTPDGALRRLLDDSRYRFHRRQDMNGLCRLSGAVYAVGRDDLLGRGELLVPPVGWVDNDDLEAVNIDEDLDLEWARFLWRRLNPVCRAEEDDA